MSLENPITIEQVLVVAAIAVVLFFVVGFLRTFRKPLWSREPSKPSKPVSFRKAAPYLGLLAFLLLYPFVPPVLHKVTNWAYGVNERAPIEVDVTRPSALMKLLATRGFPGAQQHVDSLKVKEAEVIASAQAAAQENASAAEIAADQVAGGGVQLGTFFTKLWITIVFYLLFTGLPWWIQRFTHPAPTAWAKDDYSTDFKSLGAQAKFESYGRLQFTQTMKVVGAALAAALLV